MQSLFVTKYSGKSHPMSSQVVHELEPADSEASLQREASTSPQKITDELDSDDYLLNPRRLRSTCFQRTLSIAIICFFALHFLASIVLIIRSKDNHCIMWSSISILRTIVGTILFMKFKSGVQLLLHLSMCVAIHTRYPIIDSCAQVSIYYVHVGLPLRTGAFRNCM
jgi:hypothetical protein